MTLYFDGPGTPQDYFTISVPNLPTAVYTLLLSSEYTKKLEPKAPDAIEPWNAIDCSVVDTNDRYTTFEMALNANYEEIKDTFRNGIYNIKIGVNMGTVNQEYIYEGTAKVITAASQDAAKNIKKYESDNETNSGYVFYSDTL